MSVERDILAKQLPVFSLTYELACKNQIHLKPLYSISSALFCVFAQFIFARNPFSFSRLRTFSDNYLGWGYAYYVPPRTADPRANRAHLRKTVPPNHVFSDSCKRVRNVLKINDFKYLYLHTHAHSFAGSLSFSITSQNIPGVHTPNCLILGFWSCGALVKALAEDRQECLSYSNLLVYVVRYFRDVFFGDSVEAVADGVGGETGAEQTALKRGDAALVERAAEMFHACARFVCGLLRLRRCAGRVPLARLRCACLQRRACAVLARCDSGLDGAIASDRRRTGARNARHRDICVLLAAPGRF